MAREVLWTATAKSSLADIKHYLLLNFSQKEFDSLKVSIQNKIVGIQNGNVKHIYYEQTDTYKVILHKRASMYYRITPTTIYIMAIWDNRKMEGKQQFEP